MKRKRLIRGQVVASPAALFRPETVITGSNSRVSAQVCVTCFLLRVSNVKRVYVAGGLRPRRNTLRNIAGELRTTAVLESDTPFVSLYFVRFERHDHRQSEAPLRFSIATIISFPLPFFSTRRFYSPFDHVVISLQSCLSTCCVCVCACEIFVKEEQRQWLFFTPALALSTSFSEMMIADLNLT